MTKQLLAWVFACLSGLCSAQEIVWVTFENLEGPGPQGNSLLVSDKEGEFSLGSVSQDRATPEVKMDGIIPALEKEYPYLVGKITISPLGINTADLVKAGQIQICGFVKNPGKYPADTFGACMTKAAPTEFGSIKRIQVINGGKYVRVDLTKKNSRTSNSNREPLFSFRPNESLDCEFSILRHRTGRLRSFRNFRHFGGQFFDRCAGFRPLRLGPGQRMAQFLPQPG